MADFLKTEDQVKMSEIVEKLVKQNSKRCSSTEGYYDIPCSSTSDIYASCPELARVTVVPGSTSSCAESLRGGEEGASGSAGMQHIYHSGQLVAIGHRVATQMLDPSGQREMQRSRVHLDERLRSAGIYHNRLVSHRQDLQSVQMQMQLQQLQGQEQGGRGDTDPGKRTPM
ncbi:uncharacterized protein Dana_GF21103 [Drosophila ananassae]|uniref:Uncharacterized protein n=1 Tax=Drosophila ananassae TaxID=7217 RepID=B3MQY0_DROAN|nr:uncharacterized protein LOC6503792 [Drosophila ananassae]EDV34185.1 uncharacterized protein Dana_GF21103 [Drosophila ananassae]